MFNNSSLTIVIHSLSLIGHVWIKSRSVFCSVIYHAFIGLYSMYFYRLFARIRLADWGNPIRYMLYRPMAWNCAILAGDSEPCYIGRSLKTVLYRQVAQNRAISAGGFVGCIRWKYRSRDHIHRELCGL